MMYRARIESPSGWRRYSQWYATPIEVAYKFANMLAARQGEGYFVCIESGEPTRKDIGF